MSQVEQLAEFIDREIKALSSDTRQQLEVQVFAGESLHRVPSFPQPRYWRRCESPEREGS